VQSLVYFGRMLDKIKANAQELLDADYVAKLGDGFDLRCVTFLHVKYPEVIEQVNRGRNDEEILEWCFAHGRRPTPDDIHVWNEFMRKRGWDDELAETLARRKKEAGMAKRGEIRTMFEFIDADEGRPLAGAA
jgi:Domain of unknown function (DUF5069)